MQIQRAAIALLLTLPVTQTLLASDLPTVSTTASRTPVAIEDTGSAISIIGRERIEASNATTVAELLRSIPGLHVNQQGSRGAVTQLRVRGAEANQVLVLIDGVEANDIAQGGEFNFAHLSAQQVQRIEVLRGPQSALWGSDALAGVVNIITRSDQAPGTKFDMHLEAGSFGATQAGFNVAAASDKGRIQLYANHQGTDGTNISTSGGEEDGYKNTTVAINGDYAVSDNLVFTGNVRRTSSNVEFDGTDFAVTGLPVDADNETEADQLYFRLGTTYVSLDGRLSQRLAFARTDTDNENDTGNPIADQTRSTLDQWQYQADLFLGQHTLSFVADHESIDYVQRGPVGFGDPNQDLDTKTLGPAVEYRFSGDLWDFSVSGRHESNDDFDDANTYRLTAAWQTPVEPVRLFAAYGRAVKNPTFTERFGFFKKLFIGNPDLEPEQSKGWELGLRFSDNEDRFRTSASYFETVLENEINGFVFDAVAGNFTAANIDGESNRAGFELESEWQVSEQFVLHGSYTYIDSTSENAAGRDTDEVRRPTHTTSLNGHYQWDKAGIYVGVDFNGEQTDVFFPPFPTPQQVVTLDSYTLLNIAGHYQLSEHVRLNARLENALNEDFEEVFGYETPGFTAHAGVKLTW
ncbi:MAG: vitamin B12 transporter [Candidatus Azotimanducaceae bacterium]|jgi:vitamin B12 transporter